MEASIRNLKKAFRLRVQETISCMSIEERLMQSDYVVDKVLRHPRYLAANRVGIYLSLPDEIQTDRIVKHMFHVGKSCFVPRYNLDGMNMIKMKSLKELDTFPKTKDNIRQPSEDCLNEDALSNDGLDLLIVPGRAFTKSGYRLGRGRGYYDKYLSRYKKELPQLYPFTIGLAFAQQIFEEIPVEKTDVKLDDVLFDDRDQCIFLNNAQV